MLVVFVLFGVRHGVFSAARRVFFQKSLMIVLRTFHRFGRYALGVASFAALSRKDDKRRVFIEAERVSDLSVKRRVLVSEFRSVVGVIAFQRGIHLKSRRFERRRHGRIAARGTAAERARAVGRADQIVRRDAEYAHPFFAA